MHDSQSYMCLCLVSISYLSISTGLYLVLVSLFHVVISSCSSKKNYTIKLAFRNLIWYLVNLLQWQPLDVMILINVMNNFFYYYYQVFKFMMAYMKFMSIVMDMWNVLNALPRICLQLARLGRPSNNHWNPEVSTMICQHRAFWRSTSGAPI